MESAGDGAKAYRTDALLRWVKRPSAAQTWRSVRQRWFRYRHRSGGALNSDIVEFSDGQSLILLQQEVLRETCRCELTPRRVGNWRLARASPSPFRLVSRNSHLLNATTTRHNIQSKAAVPVPLNPGTVSTTSLFLSSWSMLQGYVRAVPFQRVIMRHIRRSKVM